LKTVTLNGPGNLEIVEKPVPVPGPEEALVRIKYCGICGSDLHAFENGFLLPGLTIGHEFSGIIESVGDNCDCRAPGEYVTGNNIIGCGNCSSCRKGLDNLCLEMRRLGITDQGAMAEYAVIPAKDLVKLPKDVSLEQAALTEPLSVGLHAINKININRDDKYLILGAGTIGLVVLALLKYLGVENVVVVEPNPERGAIAKRMGAAKVINPEITKVNREINSLTDNRGMNVVFECAGLPETIQEACSLGVAGATVVVLGICYQPVKLNFLNLVTQEINIITAFGKTSKEFREAAGLIAGGLVDLSPLITGIVPVAEVAKAFHQPSRGKIKTLVVF
jgi:2-desacetyl-2-hydroxyethyl bacteriochlorophyllide A dehydrogenase